MEVTTNFVNFMGF